MEIAVELTTYPGLDDRITILRAGDEVDAVFVRTLRYNVLVDTLATPSLCRQALALISDRMGDRPLLVVNSHMDWDHFWGNVALRRDVPIIAHSVALERLRDPSSLKILSEKKHEPRFGEVEIVAPTITFSGETMTLQGGDLTLELIHTPGHTPDHIAVWIPEIRICLAVDAVEFPIPEVWSKDPADLQALCKSLKRIRDLQAQHVVLAHGQSASPAIIDANLRYFSALRDRVAGLSEHESAVAALTEGSRLPLQDFVGMPRDMPSETLAFYERCHRSNLLAALEARNAGVAFI
ncbi:MBL fold metallo-hydrolase [Neorhizobium sp. P12A]|uniref:MBL fold metallo-hydrolase n=1 Tax=Neorhizobium sp. P12A TaxID=2268027 RepID=UPI0011ED256C|nr:MBL fold metallo-hydrolase [Neorhizobium sp. P12A]KAA0693373.1 MBL fold metallo-hydrolase [Neorhizobium sp. P12A]